MVTGINATNILLSTNLHSLFVWRRGLSLTKPNKQQPMSLIYHALNMRHDANMSENMIDY